MSKLLKIRGFVALPILIGGAVIAAGLVGGLIYKYENNQSVSSIVNKDKMLAQVSGVAAPTITVTSPNGGENFLQEKDMVIKWTSANMGSLNIEIDLLNSNGAIMEDYRIALETANTGSYIWTIPASLPNGSYKVMVSAKEKMGASDTSDTYFNIMTSDSLKIVSPSSGEQLTAGQTYNIRWSGLSSGNNEYSVYLIGGTLYSDGVYLGNAKEMDKDIKSVSVMIPSNLSAASNYQIKFIGKAFESTSGVFTITAPPASIKVLSPNGGENLTLGNFYNITWQSANLPSDDLTSVSLENSAGALICSLGQVPTSFSQMQFDLSKSSCYNNNNEKIVIAPGQYKIWLNSAVNGVVGRSDNYFTISAPVVDTFKIISPSSGEQLIAGQTYNVRWSGLSSGNNEYSVYLIGGIDRSQWSLGTAYEMDKDIKGISVTIPSNIPTSSSYQIRFIGKAWQSDSDLFTITAKPTCTASTSCVPQYCQYGGDLKKCTVKAADCSTSSYTTGGCNSAPNYTTCDSTAKAIVDSVGGCEKIDKSLYSNIYNVCCMPAVVTKESLLSLLNTALADGVISGTEKTALLTALNSYLK